MQSLVVDTDVFSFFFKKDSRAALYSPHVTNGQLCLSFQSVGELRYWALVRPWGEVRKQSLDQALTRYVIIPSDNDLSRHWAEVTAHRRSIGRPIDCGDAWIAATALRHDATLLTHNASHYAEIPNLRMVTFGI